MIHIFCEPKVTLLARQEFLGAPDIRWTSDTEVRGQALAEFAGRLCFDRDTQVLTRDGWKLFSELDGGDVLTKNPVSGEAEYQAPLAFHRYEYRGNLYCAEGRDISFAVTPEHRQWGRFRLHSGRLGEYCFVRTEEIGRRVFAIDGAADAWSGTYPDAIELREVRFSQRLADAVGEYGTRSTLVATQRITGRDRLAALARLCAFYATEGSLSRQKGSGQGIIIYGNHVASVVQLCRSLELPHSIWTDPRNGVHRIIVGGGVQWRTFFEHECGRGSPNKKLPRWVLDLPVAELREIWRILVETDGHTYPNGRQSVVTTSEMLAGQCQEILCKLGFKSSVTRQVDRQGTNYPTYLVSRKSSKPALINYRVPLRQVWYEGDVFCLTVPNGTLFVRRNGRPHFSGNCYLSFGPGAGLEGGHKLIPGRTTNEVYLANILRTKHGSVLEHAVWSFLFEGVSRALTHELVRHRHFSYSQLSQRYVDESGVAFVLPPEIAEGTEAFDVWKRSCDRALEEYRALLTLVEDQVKDEPSKTLRRKRARQTARSVLPNATETKIVVTGNARAFRHFIELRGSGSADTEIRRLALVVLRTLQQEAPALFGDYRVCRDEGGNEVIETDYPGV